MKPTKFSNQIVLFLSVLIGMSIFGCKPDAAYFNNLKSARIKVLVAMHPANNDGDYDDGATSALYVLDLDALRTYDIDQKTFGDPYKEIAFSANGNSVIMNQMDLSGNNGMLIFDYMQQNKVFYKYDFTTPLRPYFRIENFVALNDTIVAFTAGSKCAVINTVNRELRVLFDIRSSRHGFGLELLRLNKHKDTMFTKWANGTNDTIHRLGKYSINSDTMDTLLLPSPYVSGTSWNGDYLLALFSPKLLSKWDGNKIEGLTHLKNQPKNIKSGEFLDNERLIITRKESLDGTTFCQFVIYNFIKDSVEKTFKLDENGYSIHCVYNRDIENGRRK